MYFENDQEQITITVIDKGERENAKKCYTSNWFVS